MTNQQSKELTPEEAMAMPLEEVMAMEGLNEYARQPDQWPSTEQAAALRPPVGGLPTGLMGPLGVALDGVYCEKGEHVVENAVSRHGLCRLRVSRLGSPVGAQLYLDQIGVRVGVRGLQGWTWCERSSGQPVHVLLLVWQQN